MMYLDEYESPVGRLSLASDGPHLCGLWLDGQKYFQEKLAQRVGLHGDEESETLSGSEAREESPGLQAAREWLDAYFAHPGIDPGPLPPIALHGTAFQEEVWRQLTCIPYGKLSTYGAIAQAIEHARGNGSRTSARAVGAAVGRNPVSIIVPCHRVVGAAGSLTGYAGGIARKAALLRHEGINTPAVATRILEM